MNDELVLLYYEECMTRRSIILQAVIVCVRILKSLAPPYVKDIVHWTLSL